LLFEAFVDRGGEELVEVFIDVADIPFFLDFFV
jgi:hypothetical protein